MSSNGEGEHNLLATGAHATSQTDSSERGSERSTTPPTSSSRMKYQANKSAPTSRLVPGRARPEPPEPPAPS
jgi:hypothetical protein